VSALQRRASAGQPTQPIAQEDPQAAAARLGQLTRLRPKLAILLGSGFQGLCQQLETDASIPFTKLPGFPPIRVAGHLGTVLAGSLEDVPVLLVCGRAHYYEGLSLDAVTFPVRALAAFGVTTLLLTNAAGGIDRRFRPGDFMCVTDHVNLMGVNPLRGRQSFGETCFVDLTQVYSPWLNRLLTRAARSSGIRLHSGVYVAVSGPTYETPAEIRAFARLGGQAIGMSTVPEAIVARQCKLNVAAVSCITNPAAGRNVSPLTHSEVLAMGEKVQEKTTKLLSRFVRLHGTAGSDSPPPALRKRPARRPAGS
jgi:purine-nucleoside phosphorylase